MEAWQEAVGGKRQQRMEKNSQEGITIRKHVTWAYVCMLQKGSQNLEDTKFKFRGCCLLSNDNCFFHAAHTRKKRVPTWIITELPCAVSGCYKDNGHVSETSTELNLVFQAVDEFNTAEAFIQELLIRKPVQVSF